MKLEPYDILFKTKSGFISNLIKWKLQSNYSHVGLIVDNFHCVEIDYKYPLKIRHFSYALGDFNAYRIPDLTTMQKEKMINFIQKTLNSKYDLAEIINYFGFGFNDRDDRWICISWIDELLEQSGVEIIKDIKVHKFEDLIEKYGLVRVD